MTTYRFDSSFDGLLCCVFAAFTRHERDVQLERDDSPSSLFGGMEEIPVTTDESQSDRVWNAMQRLLSPAELNAIAASFLCGDPAFDTPLFRLICRIFDHGAACVRDFSSPDTLAMLRNARCGNGEAHRMLQFMPESCRRHILRHDGTALRRDATGRGTFPRQIRRQPLHNL